MDCLLHWAALCATHKSVQQVWSPLQSCHQVNDYPHLLYLLNARRHDSDVITKLDFCARFLEQWYMKHNVHVYRFSTLAQTALHSPVVQEYVTPWYSEPMQLCVCKMLIAPPCTSCRCGCPWWTSDDWDARCVRCGWDCEHSGYDDNSQPLPKYRSKWEHFIALIKEGRTPQHVNLNK